jgi:hypothetical protein
MPSRNLTQAAPQLLLDRWSRATGATLCGAVLADDSARAPFGDPEAFLHALHRAPATLRG